MSSQAGNKYNVNCKSFAVMVYARFQECFVTTKSTAFLGNIKCIPTIMKHLINAP